MLMFDFSSSCVSCVDCTLAQELTEERERGQKIIRFGFFI